MKERPQARRDNEPGALPSHATHRTECEACDVVRAGAVTGWERFTRECGTIRSGSRGGHTVEVRSAPHAWYPTSH